MSLIRILAFSSSRFGNSEYLETNLPIIKNFVDNKPGRSAFGQEINIAFIPFATADKNYEEYTNSINEALKTLAFKITTVLPGNAKSILEKSDIIMVGGGNTFKLLHDIYDFNLLDLIRDKVNNGLGYIGWSAGANILGPTLGTTNDMPIIEPKSFNALGLFPFQINPHYFNKKIEGFNGETRDQRLEEFLQLNPGISVVGLPEGAGLRKEDDVINYFGNDAGVLFQTNESGFSKKEITDGDDLSFLL